MRQGLRSVIVFFLIFGCSSVAFAQHDLSLWIKRINSETTLIPWYMYMGKKFVVDARYNFDMPRSGAVFVGKSFGSEKVSVIPTVGFIVGNYKGISVQADVAASKGRFSTFLINQYSWGIGKHDGNVRPDFIYHWGDHLIKILNWFSLGIDEQLYKETGSPAQFDIGPVARFSHRNMYFKAWPAWSAGPASPGLSTLFVTIGYTF